MKPQPRKKMRTEHSMKTFETPSTRLVILTFEQKHPKGVHVFRKIEAKRKKGGDINKLATS